MFKVGTALFAPGAYLIKSLILPQVQGDTRTLHQEWWTQPVSRDLAISLVAMTTDEHYLPVQIDRASQAQLAVGLLLLPFEDILQSLFAGF